MSSRHTKVGRIILAVMVVMALTAMPAAARPAAPTNYCTTVEAVATGSTYTINATGAGRYARVVEWPVVGAPVVVAGPTDFGLGATAYHWYNVTLGQREYQVQVSHTSLTTGYSTGGCVFRPPIPQAVVLEWFDAKPMSVTAAHVVWSVSTELGAAGYNLYGEAEQNGEQLLAFIPASNPGGTGGALYNYFDYGEPAGGRVTYRLEAVGLLGDTQHLGYVTVQLPLLAVDRK